ncbi:MAG: DUF2914 domain-containing protein [Polyangiaceae bacterium]|nr:DUF2914 domain-containing protein [Polyangiaceae bacterium]
MTPAFRYGITLFAMWSCLGGCEERSADGAPAVPTSSAPADAAAPSGTGSSAQPAPPAPPPRTRVPIELLELTITSGVEKKEPVDKLKAAAPGTRVYAHLKMRNRSSETRAVHVDFLINGKLRTPLKLNIEPSWSFRTWGYNTLQASDSGELEVQVYDDAGTTLERVKLPIRSK